MVVSCNCSTTVMDLSFSTILSVQGELLKDATDDEFMQLYEKMPEFDDLDDCFVENEEQWTGMVACFIDEHIDRFAKVVS